MIYLFILSAVLINIELFTESFLLSTSIVFVEYSVQTILFIVVFVIYGKFDHKAITRIISK